MLVPRRFEWQTVEGGYEARELSEPVRVGGASALGEQFGERIDGLGLYLFPRKVDSPKRPTRPASQIALHTEFARLRTILQIESFASEHGFLGAPVTGKTKINRQWVECESVAIWLLEIQKLRAAIDLWTAIINNQVPARSEEPLTPEQLHQEIDKYLEQHIKPVIDVIVDNDSDEPWQSVYQPDDLAELQKDTEEIFRGHLTISRRQPRQTKSASNLDAPLFFLSAKVTAYAQALAPPVVQWVPADGQFQLQLSPSTLLGVLWAQFADGLIGGAEYRECQHCHKLFEISLRAHRKSKLYCNPKCNLQAWRERNPVGKRKKGARPLHQRKLAQVK